MSDIERMAALADMPTDEFMHSRKIPAPSLRCLMWRDMFKSGMKHKQIGAIFGKDRTTVIAGIKRVPNITRPNGYGKVLDIYEKYISL